MHIAWALFSASASAGLLVYSGRLLVPAARFRPEDIIAYKSPTNTAVFTIGPGAAPWPVFPEDDIVVAIRDVLDGKVGFDLLVFGTIGSVGATIVDAFTRTWSGPSWWDLAGAAAVGVLGYGGGWWWTTHSGWYGRQAKRLLVHCFLAWLEREVGDPKAKHQDFGLTVVSTARTSGFSLLGGLGTTQGLPRTDDEDRAAARRIVALARQHRYRWRRDDFRQWAGETG